IFKRILILIPVILVITVMLFIVTKIMPGDPIRAMIPNSLRHDQYVAAYNAMHRRLGHDKSWPEQYVRWIYNITINGNLGYSTMYNKPVAQCIGEPLGNTILLNVCVNITYLLIALPVGIKMATNRGKLFDSGMQVFSLVTYSVPAFFLALSLIYLVSITLGLLPIGGMPNTSLLNGFPLFIAWVRHLILPVVTLTIISLAGALSYVRNAMIDALSQDYIRTARSKGLSEKVVIYSHAFRNALIPISTIIVFTIFALFGGAAITETVFQYNGIGKMLISAVWGRDTMMIISMNLIFSIVNVAAVLVADIIYGLVDPRIKLK
ncbi:MAG: ABC transporter permease, partial [Defluviitaleaceae bacterium]|nr:ABC transporter permease [Defluviitaleaceae bacterium]